MTTYYEHIWLLIINHALMRFINERFYVRYRPLKNAVDTRSMSILSGQLKNVVKQKLLKIWVGNFSEIWQLC